MSPISLRLRGFFFTLSAFGLLTFLPIALGQPPLRRVLKQRCTACNNEHCSHCNSSSTAGQWSWTPSPDQERRVVVAQYNRYCVRCHGVDGKGVWDIPDVPDFTNVRWQQCRSDEQIVRLTIEGRGACMPAFRGTLSLEETWAMARYLRTFAATPVSKDLEANGQ